LSNLVATETMTDNGLICISKLNHSHVNEGLLKGR
jgi:hypothetical protein